MPELSKYLTSRDVLRRYNRKSPSWINRRMSGDPNFPKPIYIAGQKYFLAADLDAYDRSASRQSPPDMSAPKAGLDAAAAAADRSEAA